MIIDGRAIAKEILSEVASEAAGAKRPPHLTIITCTPNFETQKYLALKQRKAAEVGIATNVIELLSDCSTAGAVQTVHAAIAHTDGVVVQLPLPAQIDTAAVLAAIPVTHDVDVVNFDGSGTVLPPVVGAIAEIATREAISFVDKKITIIGAGKLVGEPAVQWLQATASSAEITVVTRDTPPAVSAVALAAADIIISGAGYPHLLTPEKIKEGVVIFDAGTSEDGGALSGDADPACAAKAALFTPVPGGIGPITIACLLKNLLVLSRQ